MKRYSVFLGRKNQYCENDYTTKCNLQIQCGPYQITNGILNRTRTKNFTIHMETEKTLNSQISLEKEEWSWKNQPSWLQIIWQSYSQQKSMAQSQKQKYRPIRLENPEMNPMGSLFLTKEATINNEAKTASSINGAWKTGQLHVKEWN